MLALPAAAQSSPEASGATDPALRSELLSMYEADQAIRQRLIEAGIAEPDSALLAEMVATDAAHLARVVEIVDVHGWPGAALVGMDGSNAAFMILQHGDTATQERLLPLVEAAYRSGDLHGQSYALLLDRVLVGKGEPQVYGTQAGFGAEGEILVSPLADPETVDARRAEVGLPPLAEYLAMLESFYFPEATGTE
ncbi:hypothetical protein BSZ36_02465 [Rubricoccus marinus]|uniref:Uncharacterized protein n=1 Tax=Rubricoccus marinus TaxID=716817 RepID=A0A259U3G9_9BACT|nr:hypothetical protein BSZ36_02465 [Rubricoccus marinus]